MSSIASGYNRECVLLQNGTVLCWGRNYNGELGDGTNVDRYVPVAVSGLNDASSITSGYYHACVILQNGTACCWGLNDVDQLVASANNGVRTPGTVPVVVPGLTNVRSIATKVFHACAILEDGTPRCWGYNAYGQLGDGTTTSSNVPIRLSCGERHQQGLANTLDGSIMVFHRKKCSR